MDSVRIVGRMPRFIRCEVVAVAFMWCIMILATGCDKNGSGEEEKIRPSFRTAHMYLEIGEVSDNPVLNASDVELISAPSCVKAMVSGCSLAVEGIKSGEGEVWASADGQRIRCRVSVIDTSIPGDKPVSDDDIPVQLADSRTRVVLMEQVVAYAATGNLFMLSADRKSLSVTSLLTGDEIRFSSEVALCGNRRNDVSEPVALEEACLSVNGHDMALASARLMRSSENGVWLRLVTSARGVVWIVVDDLFDF